MGRIIAIDYGKKKTGIAVSDPLKIIAGGLVTLPSFQVVNFLKDYMTKEDVELIIIGEPRQMNYDPSENMDRVKAFEGKLRKSLSGVKIEFVDERFTSVLAQKAILDSGLKKKKRQDKELVDKLSATIILQSYLETLRL